MIVSLMSDDKHFSLIQMWWRRENSCVDFLICEGFLFSESNVWHFYYLNNVSACFLFHFKSLLSLNQAHFFTDWKKNNKTLLHCLAYYESSWRAKGHLFAFINYIWDKFHPSVAIKGLLIPSGAECLLYYDSSIFVSLIKFGGPIIKLFTKVSTEKVLIHGSYHKNQS